MGDLGFRLPKHCIVECVERPTTEQNDLTRLRYKYFRLLAPVVNPYVLTKRLDKSLFWRSGAAQSAKFFLALPKRILCLCSVLPSRLLCRLKIVWRSRARRITPVSFLQADFRTSLALTLTLLSQNTCSGGLRYEENDTLSYSVLFWSEIYSYHDGVSLLVLLFLSFPVELKRQPEWANWNNYNPHFRPKIV